MGRSIENGQQTADKKNSHRSGRNGGDDNNYDTAVITSNFMTINSIDSSRYYYLLAKFCDASLSVGLYAGIGEQAMNTDELCHDIALNISTANQ